MGRLSADFGLRGCKVYTSGKLEDTANENKNYTDSVIIIDEAHRYRTEMKTQRPTAFFISFAQEIRLLFFQPRHSTTDRKIFFHLLNFFKFRPFYSAEFICVRI